MNDVQRNFKKQIREIEKENEKKWRKEVYRDHYTGKKMVRWYDVDGRLLKTEEKKKSSAGSLFYALVIIFVFCAVIWFIRPNIGKANSSVPVVNTTVRSSAKITVLNRKATHEGTKLNINGTLRNDGGKDIKHLKVYIDLLDSSGSLIKTVSAKTDNVAVGQSWHYQIIFDDPKQRVKKFSIDNYDVT